MLLDQYEQQGVLFNTNFKAMTSDGVQAYRGELVLVEGEVADTSGRRKPPTSLVRDVVLLANNDKLQMVVGGLDAVADIQLFIERYATDLAPDASIFLLAPNAHTEAKVDIAGVSGYLLPWEAMVWAQLTEELRLEKSDFKGLSAADKVATAYDELKCYEPSFPFIPLAEMIANATSAKKETHGAI
ncbi:hypothetical protein GCM10011369_20910 [Neiella marina]|uniref:Uncharacterized protein n=1 Tax=Neiella marina TaxID=508461 RepID=A0A8J2U5K3_9GAMM|nr:hypothetical protein [Neiella marina]GGA78785.1 hypothetical protein GCM10011369_20910 [Neiella marina]